MKSKIKKNQPILKKILVPLIWTIIGIFIGMFIHSVCQSPIDNFVEKNIFHKQPDLRITITSFYFLNRTSTDLIDLPKTLGYKVIPHEGGIEISWLDNEPGNFTTLIIDDNLVIYPNILTTIISANDSNNVKYCLIESLTTEGYLEAYKTTSIKGWFDTKFLENPNCENCIRHTISVYNVGNKAIENQRSEVCALNRIYNITGNDDFWVYDDNKCFVLRRQTFLEKDEIIGYFNQEIPKKYTINDENFESEGIFYNVSVWNDGQIEAIRGLNVEAWSKSQAHIEQEKVWNICVIVIPYCTPGW